MPWHGREWGELSLSLEILSHDDVHTTTVKKVQLTSFSWLGYCYRNWEDKKRIYSSLNVLVDMDDLLKDVGKP